MRKINLEEKRKEALYFLQRIKSPVVISFVWGFLGSMYKSENK